MPHEDERPIAIATEAFEAEFEVREFDIGRGRNAGRGAGRGFVEGAALAFKACGSDCGDAAVLMLLLAPFTAAAGHGGWGVWQDEVALRDIAQDAIDGLGLTIANLLL